MSHITDNLKTQLLKIPYAMIPKMIEAVHFNNKKPENKNILIPNKKDKFVKIYKNNKWTYQDIDSTLDNLLDDKYNTIDNHYEVYENKNICNNIKTNYLKFKKIFNEGDREFLEKLKKECEMVLFNNR